ncbi:ComF family protein [Lewinella sp. W8]|uniref:ComF family protein n=1 Tax=Lewinella sp. W8 TaxID=2528208 RepID=UPI001068C4B2|nr:ComF family protein [Lewinella sp. W8]MTB52291.1 ComF family protein [Lewinella sp. W8]
MIRRTARQLLEGISTLFFPRLCLSCERPLAAQQELQLCVPCFESLAFTDYWTLPENPVTDRLAGRLPLQRGVALLYFNRDTVCQSLIHALKYNNRPEIGRQLGKLLGQKLREAPGFEDLSGIVPVPIHAKRRHQRGYNQAEIIAAGVAEALSLPVYPDALLRRQFAGSQTKRDRMARLDNVRTSFQAGRGDFSNQHLLLIDDVLTTGATLDFCGNALLEHHPSLRISVGTLAITEN